MAPPDPIRGTPQTEARSGRFTVDHTSPDGRIRVVLEIEPQALMSLAEAFGEIAADLWLDGKLDLL